MNVTYKHAEFLRKELNSIIHLDLAENTGNNLFTRYLGHRLITLNHLPPHPNHLSSNSSLKVFIVSSRYWRPPYQIQVHLFLSKHITLHELQNLCKYKKIREKQDWSRPIYIKRSWPFNIWQIKFIQFPTFKGSFWGFAVFLDDRIHKYTKI